MDLHNGIEMLEAEMARLISQQVQEKAMAQVLPLRFEMNMAAFEHFIPAIFQQFKDYRPEKTFKFFCNENGAPNLLWSDSNEPFYGQDPFSECKQQIDSVLASKHSIQTLEFAQEDNPLEFIHVDFMNKMMEKQKSTEQFLPSIGGVGADIPLMLMFGVGLGYQLAYLYEQCRPHLFFVIEPDLDLFYASLFTFDWYALLEHIDREELHIHILLGQNKDEVVQDIAIGIAKVGACLSAASVGFWHYKSEVILDLIARTKQEFFLLVSGWGFFDDNIIAMSHCMANVSSNIPFLVAGRRLNSEWENVPVFIVGNGPSLDMAIETLKSVQERVIILSCGSALSALHKAGIRPDIHVQVERTKVVPDSHQLLNDAVYLKDILFLSVDVIHPDCAQQFERVGLAFKPFEPGVSLLRMHAPVACQRDMLNGANPLVGNTGLAMACRLGFKTIYLCGIDNGYKNAEHHHSRFSFYFDAQGKSKEKLSAQVTQRSKHLTAGNFGGEVETTSMMINSRMVMENLLGANPELRVFNCADGAKIKGAAPLFIGDISIDAARLDKSALLDHIANELYQPMDISVEHFHDKFNVDLFDDVLDKFIQEWDRAFSTRQEIISCMMRIYDYLSAIRLGGYEHVYRCLIGSVNYSFSVTLSTLYKFEPSTALFTHINEMIAEMRHYFMAMKERYKHALSSVDRKAHGLFE